MTPKPQLNPILKLALDLGPLVLFFFANSHYDIFVATATFMVAVLVAMVVSYALTRHFPIMTIVTAVIVLVFGGLTLFLHNDMFIKIKPTIIYALFGGVLLGGLFVRQVAARHRAGFDVPAYRGRLAQADLALGAVLLRARHSQ